jgi:hypothetical protein
MDDMLKKITRSMAVAVHVGNSIHVRVAGYAGSGTVPDGFGVEAKSLKVRSTAMEIE